MIVDYVVIVFPLQAFHLRFARSNGRKRRIIVSTFFRIKLYNLRYFFRLSVLTI